MNQDNDALGAVNFIIPTIRAEHLTSAMNIGVNDSWKILRPLGNKEGQRFFPDDEVYVRLPSDALKATGRTVIVHSGAPDPNGGIVELEMILEILRDSHSSVEVFFTYFPYGMQDHAFHGGEVNAAKSLILKLTRYYNVKKIYILDAHFAGQEWVKFYPIAFVSALDILKAKAMNDFPEAVFMAPDAGSQRRAKISGTEKTRDDSYSVEIEYEENFRKAVNGRMVGVVDDLVETGGTVAKFAETCHICGAKDTIALITHGVLVSGIKRLKAVYKALYLTNSVNRGDSNVDVSGLILEAITSNAT